MIQHLLGRRDRPDRATDLRRHPRRGAVFTSWPEAGRHAQRRRSSVPGSHVNACHRARGAE